MSSENLPATRPRTGAGAATARYETIGSEPSPTLLEVLLRHKTLLITCTAVGLALGITYQLLAPPKYQSTAEIFIEQPRSGATPSPLAPAGVTAAQPSTHASVLKSTPVLTAALQDPQVAATATIASEDQPLTFLRKELAVDFGDERETVAVSLKTESPQESATIVNAVVRAYLRSQHMAVRVVDPADLTDDAEPAAGGGVMNDRIIASRLMLLSEELARAEVERQDAAVRLRDAEAAGDDLAQLGALLEGAGLRVGSEALGELAYLRSELSRLEQLDRGLPAGWGPSHERRRQLQRQAQSVQQQMRQVHESAAGSMRDLLADQLTQAKGRADELRARLGDEQAAASAGAQLPVVVIEPAQPAERKASPLAMRTLPLSAVLGLLAGVALTLYRELDATRPTPGLDDQPTRDDVAVDVPAAPAVAPDDEPIRVENAPTGLPVLGRIPRVAGAGRLSSPDFDDTASSIHQIRAVLQVQAHRHGTRAFAFTSPRRGAGKTSVAVGVASSLAMSGTRTLVVDCDLAGRIARGQTGSPGSSHPPMPEPPARGSASMDGVALEQGFLDQDPGHAVDAADHPAQAVGIAGVLDGRPLEDCVVHATVPGLGLLPASHATTAHIGKMSDAFIRRLIDQASQQFDLILFDTGPVPGSVEALLAASQAHGVVVVVPEGETRGELDRCLSYLKVVGAPLIGTVFNKTRQPRADAATQSRKKPAAVDADSAGAAKNQADTDRPASTHGPDSSPAVRNLDEPHEHDLADGDDEIFLDQDVTLGSGILAAAVFSDRDSAFASDDWELKETSASEFSGSVSELFEDEADRDDSASDQDDRP